MIDGMEMVTRKDWGAEPPLSVRPLKHPVKNLAEDYVTGVERCYNTEDCKERVKELQRRALDEGKPDIAYNFLIGDDGKVYEGRGWNAQVTDDFDWDGINVGHLGSFSLEHPPRLQMSYALNDMIYYAQHKNLLRENYEHWYLNRGEQRDKDNQIIYPTE